MPDLVSEPLSPRPGSFDTTAMARGEPGLPSGFTWRGRPFDVVAVLETWKESSPEGGRAGGEHYLRRHYFRIRMSDCAVWTVYFVRQTPRTGKPTSRWFLYTVDSDGA